MRELVTLLARVHLVGGASCLAEPNLQHIYERVNELWSLANVHFRFELSATVMLGTPDLRSLATSDGTIQLYFAHQRFYSNRLNNEDWSNPYRLVTNGFNVSETNVVVVRDHQDPGSPPLPRVAAHEIGHVLLGPDHPKDPDNLMSSGKVGTSLTKLQQERAFTTAQRLSGVANDRRWVSTETIRPSTT